MVQNINKQHTIAKAIGFEGKGLQTNAKASVRLLPAEPNSGIRFVCIDHPDKPVIEADCDLVVSTERCTKLGKNGVSISTVEHLLAALKGCYIDNVVIEVSGEEIPIMDGSSKLFVEGIQKAGIEEQNAKKIWWDINEVIIHQDNEKNAELIVVPSTDYRLSTVIGFPGKSIDLQHATLSDISGFNEEIANARTFCFFSEIEGLLQKGLIKGGDEENALVIIDKKITEEDKKKLGIHTELHQNENYTTHRPVRFPNEPARHKLLDLVGDLSLCGYAFKGHIISNKPGHKSNIAFAKKIKQFIKSQQDLFDSSSYLQQKESLYNIQQIANILPHRYPFLLVDKVLKMDEKEIVATKNVTMNEPFFQGHFPGNPVMPGVLIVEAMAQVGGILILSREKKPENFDTYFLKIDQCKFKRKVRPGDTIIIRMQTTLSSTRGIHEMKGQVFVHDNLCCEALLMAQIVDRTTVK